MELMPVKKKMIDAMDDSNRYLAYAIILGLFCLVLAGVFSLLPGSILSMAAFMCSIAVCLVNIYHLYIDMKGSKAKVTDMNGSMIGLTGECLVCYQTDGDVYEECSIAYDEVSAVTEITRRGRCGFLISVVSGADTRKSYIRVNGLIVDEDIFEVKGGLYDTKKFIGLYNLFLERIPADVRADTSIRTEKRNWYPKSKKQQLLMLVMPMAVSAVLEAIPMIIKVF